MRALFVFAFCAFMLEGFSQSGGSIADSIKAAIRTNTSNDTLRLNLLLELSKKAVDSKEGSAAASEAIALAAILGNKRKQGEACYSKAANELALGNDTVAYIALQQLLQIAQTLQDDAIEAKACTGFARVFQFRNQYFKAIEYNEKALELYKNTGNNEQTGGASNDLGNCYNFLSDYIKANQYYLEAKKYYEKAGKKEGEAMVLNNLGAIERNLKKYTSSIGYLRSALAIEYGRKDSSRIAKALQGIGITYDDMKKSDSALWYYLQAMAINKRNNFKLNTAENLTNIGIVYKDLNRYEEAYLALKEGLQLFTELNQTHNIRQTEINLGELFCNAPDSFFGKKTIPLTARYAAAGSLFQTIISYAKESEDPDLESRAWMGLSETRKKQGDYKSALEAWSVYTALQDSIVNEEKIEATTRQIDKNEFEKQEANTQAMHQAAIQRQQTIKNAIAGGAAIVLIVGFISFLFYKKNRDAVQKQKEAELKTEVAETEMKALRAQMNPHFIFNSLNSIGDYIARNNTKLADEYLVKFARLMRITLENSEQKEVPLAADLKALELYMQLEALRMNHKFGYTITVDDSVDKENTLVPPLILQPFVENSIWHGIASKNGQGNITVHISYKDGMLHCRVEDDGIGRIQAALVSSQQLHKEKKSLGMKITKERIDMLNKLKKSTAAIQFSDLPQGTRVEVILPLELSF